MNKILILSPHFDDGLMMGGTISRWLEEGKEIWYVIFTKDHKTTEPEIKDAIFSLGIANDHLISLGFEERTLGQRRQEVLEKLLELRGSLSPELVLCHSRYDTHQDHKTVSEEAYRAFKQVSMWGYELPWNCPEFKTDIFITLQRRHIDNKIKALNCIPSQKDRRYYDPKRREAHAIFRGEQKNKDFAEAFELISQIL